ncbi:MAG: hypothetical protein AB1589_37290, partial [Cyanobacteriota bacterium]
MISRPSQIYEFSRGFDNPHYSQRHQRWVSGGFRREVGPSLNNHSVPKNIKAAVEQGDFRINDNYPPEID